MSKSVKKIKIIFRLNGKRKQFIVYPMRRLIDIIREDAKLTGTKEGCGEGECGSCSVLINGVLVNSCLVPAAQVHGKNITTIEGVKKMNSYKEVEKIFMREGGTQCGICTPGMIVSALYLLKNHPDPTELQIKEHLSGNLCRCTGYVRIIEAVKKIASAGIKL